jgi:hypothetical protein
MNAETPPIIDSNPGDGSSSNKPANLARLGLRLSLVAPVVILLMILMKPG